MKRVTGSLRTAVAFLFLSGVLASCGGGVDSSAASPSSTAAPAATATPAGPLAAKMLLVAADTVSGSIGTTDEEKAMSSCVQKNRFPQGEAIVWRVRVTSPATGTALDDKGLKSVVITLPDGKDQPLKYGPHPKGQTDDYFWTTSFKIPLDYPTGAFKYKLVATSLEGLVGTYTQFNVASSMLQVIKAGSR